MTTWNLFKAELLKSRKMSVNQILMLILNIMGAFFIVSIIALAKIYGGGYLREAAVTLVYPRTLGISIMTISGFGVIMSIIYMANSIGSEYGNDTWKMILPRYGSRISFIITKLIIALLAMLLLFAFTMGFWVVLCYLGTLFLKVSSTGDLYPGEETTIYRLKILAMTAVRMTFYGLLTALVTVIGRSITSGFLGGMALFLTLASASAVPFQRFVRCMPTVHMNNIEAHWTNNTKAVGEITESFGYAISPQTSIVVVSVSIIFVLIITLYLFNKRDMAGQG